MAVLRATNPSLSKEVTPVLSHMKAQEQQHLQNLQHVMPQERVRPSLMLPVWHVAGWALGMYSAVL